MKICLTSILAIISVIAASARTSSASVTVYFRQGYRYFDPSLGRNRAVMEDFVDRVRSAAASADIGRVVIYSYASPEGHNKANRVLSRNRCVSMADYIVKATGISHNLIEMVPEGVAWDELRRLVAADPDVPSRTEVLDILDNTPLWVFDGNGRVVGGRKKQLMELAGGRVYNWLYENLFPRLRNSVGVALYLREQETSPAEPAPVAVAAPAPGPEQEPPHGGDSADNGADNLSEADASVSVSSVDTPMMQVCEKEHRFAVKTNLLYDAVLLPNLEVEWLASKHWSVALEGDVAWWSSYSRNKVYQIAMISPEVRYRINPRAPWHGMYVGAFAGAGLYDLENGGTGYRGEGLMGGLSFGYAWPVGKHLLFDAGIGAGYMF
ncbi:MAG: DUF3575 domain-containing protein, partial [Muribaculaceae bacterium]|nr:DUF3575 domain-containing protein [Muribaculaceae bacterium]